MKPRPLPSRAEIREVLDYDLFTGALSRKSGRRAERRDWKGYCKVSVSGNSYMAARIIWKLVYGFDPPAQIDHINGVRDDNRIVNLRLATPSQNERNKPVGRKGRTLPKGVYLADCKRRYKALAQLGKKLRYLGTFDTVAEAVAARAEFVKQEHGDFYNPGFDPDGHDGLRPNLRTFGH